MDYRVDDDQFAGKAGAPSRSILRVLQRHGPSSVKQLEQALHVSTNAVREQLVQLQSAGLIQSTHQPHGPGRPAHQYSLTTRAQQMLSHGYDTLLNLLFEEIMLQHSPAHLQQLLDGVGRRLAGRLEVAQPAPDLATRLQDVRAAFERQSVLLTVVTQSDEVHLQTWSCPYVEVAAEHRAVCDMETTMLMEALGQPVHLQQRIVDGAPGCCFVIGAIPQADTAIANQGNDEEQNAERTNR